MASIETVAIDSAYPNPVRLNLGPFSRPLSEDQFFEFCRANSPLRIERTSKGEILVMTPSGGEAGRQNLEAAAALLIWAKADGTGLAFDSSTGFRLPNGAMRAPDMAWLRRDRWQVLSKADREVFPPLCPDFVGEIRSRTDRLRDLQEKMREYLESGARLAWLIDPQERRVYVYRPGEDVAQLDNPACVCGDPVLPGFVLDLGPIFSDPADDTQRK